MAWKELGLYWTDLGQLGAQTRIPALTIIPDIPGGVLAGTGNGGHIYRSLDYGLTWTDIGQQYNQSRILCFARVGTAILAGTCPGGKILRSTDDGVTWTDIGQLSSETDILSLEYIGSSIVLAGTHPNGKIFRSTDEGLNWTDLGQQYAQGQIWAIINLGLGAGGAGSQYAAAGTGPGGLILFTDDQGATWSNLGQQGSAQLFASLEYLEIGQPYVLAGGALPYPQGSLIYRSSDWGATWDYIGSHDNYCVLSLATVLQGVALAGTGEGGKILRTTDYGATWDTSGRMFNETDIRSLVYVGNGICIAGTYPNAKILRSVGSTLADITGLAVTTMAGETGETQLYLSWTNNDNYVSIDINRNGATVATISGANGSYTDTLLTSNTQYIYKVRALGDSGGWTDWTATVSAYTRANQPSALTATPVSTSQINLAWTNNDTYTNIYVYRNGVYLVTLAGSAVSYPNTGLPSSTTYSYYVVGNANGLNTVNSNTAQATTLGVYTDTFSDSIVLSETPTGIADFVSTYSESLALSDSILSVFDYVEVFSDAITLTETTTDGTIDEFTEAITLTDSRTDVYALVDTILDSITLMDTANHDWYETFTDTITLTDTISESRSIRIDYRFYLGSSLGYIYLFDKNYYSDNGNPITAYFTTKQTDFADQYPQYLKQYKTVDKVRLWYVDKTASTNVTIYISTDGGVTWASQMKSLGTGDGTNKYSDFYFIKSGSAFIFKVENASSTNEFQWASLEAYFYPSGDDFLVS